MRPAGSPSVVNLCHDWARSPKGTLWHWVKICCQTPEGQSLLRTDLWKSKPLAPRWYPQAFSPLTRDSTLPVGNAHHARPGTVLAHARHLKGAGSHFRGATSISHFFFLFRALCFKSNLCRSSPLCRMQPSQEEDFPRACQAPALLQPALSLEAADISWCRHTQPGSAVLGLHTKTGPCQGVGGTRPDPCWPSCGRALGPNGSWGAVCSGSDLAVSHLWEPMKPCATQGNSFLKS